MYTSAAAYLYTGLRLYHSCGSHFDMPIFAVNSDDAYAPRLRSQRLGTTSTCMRTLPSFLSASMWIEDWHEDQDTIYLTLDSFLLLVRSLSN